MTLPHRYQKSLSLLAETLLRNGCKEFAAIDQETAALLRDLENFDGLYHLEDYGKILHLFTQKDWMESVAKREKARANSEAYQALRNRQLAIIDQVVLGIYNKNKDKPGAPSKAKVAEMVSLAVRGDKNPLSVRIWDKYFAPLPEFDPAKVPNYGRGVDLENPFDL